MATLDVDAMLERFRERAKAVKQRPLPPVAGEERQHFIAQAQLDFQDFAIIGDASRIDRGRRARAARRPHGRHRRSLTGRRGCPLATAPLILLCATRTWLSW